MSIAPTAYIHPDAQIGKNVSIGHYAVIGQNVRLEDNVSIDSHAVIKGYTTIEKNTQVSCFAVLGGSPQDISYNDEHTQLVIGENTVIREHVVIHTGTIKDRKITYIGKGCYIMCYAHIGHDCMVSDNVTIGPATQIGGHCHIGQGANLSGLVAVHHKVRIGKYTMIGGGGTILRDVIPYALTDKSGMFSDINKVGLQRQNIDKQDIKDLMKIKDDFIRGSTPLARLAETYLHSDNAYIQCIGEFLSEKSTRGILRR